MQEILSEPIGLTISTGVEWSEVIPFWIPAFFGDANRSLKEIQRDSYPLLIHELFDTTKRRYVAACDTLGVETELVERLADMLTPDLPYLPRVYRKVASWYRYAFDRESTHQAPDNDELRSAWEEYFRAEIHSVTSDEDVARAVLEAAVWPGARAASAEERVVAQLRYRYGEMTLPRRLAIQQCDPAMQDLCAVTVTAKIDPRVRPNPPD